MILYKWFFEKPITQHIVARILCLKADGGYGVLTLVGAGYAALQKTVF